MLCVASDVLFSFPDILLMIAIVPLSGPGIINAHRWKQVFTVPAGLYHAKRYLAQKGSLYVEVAQSSRKDRRLLVCTYFPTIQSLIVNFTMRIGSAIIMLP
ncbi:MAG: hypothetical protein ACLR6B_06485 [Blautia sp.]